MTDCPSPPESQSAYARDRERRLARQKAYYAQNAEKRKAYQRSYSAKKRCRRMLVEQHDETISVTADNLSSIQKP